MVKPESAARRRLPAERRREAVLAAVLPVFAAKGWAGATTRDLAAAAQVAEPILYRHFGSKAGLFDAVLERAGRRILERLEGSLARAADAPARLRALADGLPRLLEDLDDEVRVLNGTAAAHPDPRAVAIVRDAYAALGDALSQAIGAAGLRPGLAPSTAGHLLLEIGLGASLTRPLRVPGVVRGGFGDRSLALLLRALTATPSGRRRR